MKGYACDVPTPECKNRTITNRAYYGAYNLAKAYIDEVSPSRFEDEYPTHSAVRDWFREKRDDEDLKQIGRLLTDSYNQRHAADYNAESKLFADSSEKVIRWAEQIVITIRSKREEAR